MYVVLCSNKQLSSILTRQNACRCRNVYIMIVGAQNLKKNPGLTWVAINNYVLFIVFYDSSSYVFAALSITRGEGYMPVVQHLWEHG